MWIVGGVLGLALLAGAAGYVSWHFTRFVIDDEELRIETGVLFKTSRRIAFERIQSVDIIQPLAARIFSLAELRIEAGAGDSGIRLRYLSRVKAARLRDYLLARAHGTSTRFTDTADAPAPDVLFDAGVADKTLVTVLPVALVGSFLLSTEFLVPVFVLIGFAGLAVATGLGLVALGGVIPMLFGVLSLISRRVFAMFHFTLAESSRGLRVTRGLTNLTSQSVPVDRIQGVRLCQPVLWKPFGWWRVDVDIVGYGSGDREDNAGGATSVLLPVASQAQVRVALSRVLPGFAVDRIALTGAPRRARAFRWFDWWTLRYGWDDRAIVTQAGWLVHERHIVPHAKTQSVRIEQGPLQRRLRLADVHIDTPKGPVHAVAHQMDVVAARELALSQLDRARTAREVAELELLHPGELRPESAEERTSGDAVLAGARHRSGPAARRRRGEPGLRPRRRARGPALPGPARERVVPRGGPAPPALRLLGADGPARRKPAAAAGPRRRRHVRPDVDDRPALRRRVPVELVALGGGVRTARRPDEPARRGRGGVATPDAGARLRPAGR